MYDKVFFFDVSSQLISVNDLYPVFSFIQLLKSFYGKE